MAVEDHNGALLTGALRGDQNRTARFIFAGGDVEGVKIKFDDAVDDGLRHQIDGFLGGIYHRSSGNAFLDETSAGTARQSVIFQLRGSDPLSRVGEIDRPELSAIVSVKRVNRIRLRNYIDNVVCALTGNFHLGHIKRLSQYHIVDWGTEQMAETVLI